MRQSIEGNNGENLLAMYLPSLSLLQTTPSAVARLVTTPTAKSERHVTWTLRCGVYSDHTRNCRKLHFSLSFCDIVFAHHPTTPLFLFVLPLTLFCNVLLTSHLVKEGDLLKVCNGGPRRYKFVLFSDMLVYGTETIRAKLQRDHRKYKVKVRVCP